MFKWIKGIFQADKQPSTEPIVPAEKPTDIFIRENLQLADSIKNNLAENPQEETVAWLVKEFTEDVNNPKVAELFSGYYDGLYSKKDILDSYEEMVIINQEIIEGIAKLGEAYQPAMVSSIYTKNDTYKLYSEKFILNLLEDIANCKVNMKQVKKLLWEEYFDCVKTNLNTKKKTGITDEDKYQPADEIEATLIMLLEADMKARRNE